MIHFQSIGKLILLLAAALSVSAGSPPSVEPPQRPMVAAEPAAIDRVLCLMYHRFVSTAEYAALAGDERIYSMPVDRFEQQLAELRRRGFRAIDTADAVAFANGKSNLGDPSVLITIDDGNRSVLTLAVPLLRKYGLRATLFVTTDPAAFVFDPARPDQARLTDDEIRSIDPAVIDIQAHGVTHRPMRDLSDDELKNELGDARTTLGQLTGRPVYCLAIPGNWYDDRVLRFARRAGYEAVFVSDKGHIRRGSDPFRLPRHTVQGYKSLDGFQRLLSRAD